MLQGPGTYWAWVLCLLALVVSGALAYADQYSSGLIVTSMRDQVSWGFYIGNFTFLVGVAAAAVVLVIPAYVYDWKPIREIVIFGELLALSALLMCMLFVTADVGASDRALPGCPLPGGDQAVRGAEWHRAEMKAGPLLGKIEMLERLGADVVCMSTGAESALASTLGVPCAAVSCVTNWAAGRSSARLSHDDVTRSVAGAAAPLKSMLERLVMGIA